MFVCKQVTPRVFAFLFRPTDPLLSLCPVSRQMPVYSSDMRWQQANPSPAGGYLAYPILSSPQPPVSNDYAYYQIMPAPCPPMMGFYQPFHAPYGGPVQTGVVSPVSAECGDRIPPPSQPFGVASQRGRGMNRSAALPKVRHDKPLGIRGTCPNGSGIEH